MKKKSRKSKWHYGFLLIARQADSTTTPSDFIEWVEGIPGVEPCQVNEHTESVWTMEVEMKCSPGNWHSDLHKRISKFDGCDWPGDDIVVACSSKTAKEI